MSNEEQIPYNLPEEEQYSSTRVEEEIIHVERDERTGEEGQYADGEVPQGAPLTEEKIEQLRLEEEEEAKQEERRKARESNVFWQFISGNWLILEGITVTYRYLLIVAAALFLSVVSIFYKLHLGDTLADRTSEVQLLRERSLEYQRVRFNKCSHTAIVKELKRRGIPIYDIHESKTIIEN